MSRYVDIDQIIADIYEKWGCDPAYIANDTPTGIEARRDAKFIELLRSEPSIDIVRCAECKFSVGGCEWCLNPDLPIIGDDAACLAIAPDWYCACGKRKEETQ